MIRQTRATHAISSEDNFNCLPHKSSATCHATCHIRYYHSHSCKLLHYYLTNFSVWVLKLQVLLAQLHQKFLLPYRKDFLLLSDQPLVPWLKQWCHLWLIPLFWFLKLRFLRLPTRAPFRLCRSLNLSNRYSKVKLPNRHNCKSLDRIFS